MGKTAEILKDKGAVVSVFPADYLHNSSHTLEHYPSGMGVVSTPLTLPVRIDGQTLTAEIQPPATLPVSWSQFPERSSSREICLLWPLQGWLQLIPLSFMARPQLGISSANQPTWPCRLTPQGSGWLMGAALWGSIPEAPPGTPPSQAGPTPARRSRHVHGTLQNREVRPSHCHARPSLPRGGKWLPDALTLLPDDSCLAFSRQRPWGGSLTIALHTALGHKLGFQ